MPVHRVCLYRVKYNSANGFLSECGGLSLKVFDCLQIYFGTVIFLSTNTQCRFFYAKTLRFPRRFSHYSRRGGNLPPAKMRSIFLYFSAQRADYNRGFAVRWRLKLIANSRPWQIRFYVIECESRKKAPCRLFSALFGSLPNVFADNRGKILPNDFQPQINRRLILGTNTNVCSLSVCALDYGRKL